MEDAFWELLSKTDYEKISITDIVELAKVNRNSFYYHYRKLDNLASTAVQHCVEDIVETLPALTTDYSETWRNIAVQTLGVPSNQVNLHHIGLLTGEHTSGVLLKDINKSMHDCLSKWLNLDEDIDVIPHITLEFIIGGLLSIISIWPTLDNKCSANELSNLDSALLARTLYLTLVNGSVPAFWVQLLRTGLKESDESLIEAIAKTETVDSDFKDEMDGLLGDLERNNRDHAGNENSTSHRKHTDGSDESVEEKATTTVKLMEQMLESFAHGNTPHHTVSEYA